MFRYGVARFDRVSGSETGPGMDPLKPWGRRAGKGRSGWPRQNVHPFVPKPVSPRTAICYTVMAIPL